MTTPREKYTTRLAQLRKEHLAIREGLKKLALLRILLFLGAAYTAYLAVTNHWGFAGAALVLLVLFGWGVGRYEARKYHRRKLTELIRLNDTELRVLDLEFMDLPDGSRFRDAGHFYSEDLELFGPGSFFQYANRCGLSAGAGCFANRLTANNTSSVPEKQEAIRELAPQMAWRQEFYAVAKISGKEDEVSSVLDWLEGYQPFTRPVFRFGPYIFGLLVLGTFGIFLTGYASAWAAVAVFLLGLGIAGFYARRIGKLASDTSRAQDVFEGYARLVALVENQAFSSKLLQHQKGKLGQEGASVSVLLRRFYRHLAALDQRNNLLVAFLGNGFLLWDLLQARAIETWIAGHGREARQWFNCIAEMDAWCSMGNFAFNHPDFALPEVVDNRALAENPERTGSPIVVAGRDLAHPLLPPGQRVANDFEIEKGRFFVITGANMAGKSTFLRTLSLALVMANAGLPVCARSFRYSPLPLISSMRTADSLARSESYFFAELKRLQFLIAALKDRAYFVVLDEILKGTNSTDKAEGSKLFLERLVRSNATGVIATHDLSLCKVAKSEPRVANWHFDAEIREGELYFDYMLKPGICNSMNASFLLRKMGIVEE